jgi:hypothetical protein
MGRLDRIIELADEGKVDDEDVDWLICRIGELEKINTERNIYNLKLLARVEKLEAALEFYADEGNYLCRDNDDGYIENVVQDGGERARKVLEE